MNSVIHIRSTSLVSHCTLSPRCARNIESPVFYSPDLMGFQSSSSIQSFKVPSRQISRNLCRKQQHDQGGPFIYETSTVSIISQEVNDIYSRTLSLYMIGTGRSACASHLSSTSTLVYYLRPKISIVQQSAFLVSEQIVSLP